MKPFGLPPYPYDRLNDLRAAAIERFGAATDMSIGAPFDAPPAAAVDALANSGLERGYPPAIGNVDFREAARDWMSSQFGADISADQIGATVGLKEFVVGAPHWLRHRNPDKDTVLYPSISYPSYAMGAELAHGRAVPVPLDAEWKMDLDAVSADDIARASLLWVNSPGNPTGAIQDLAAIADWGRSHGIPVISDECYIEFTWDGPADTIVNHGTEGVVAIHSLSKRSNFAGIRSGFYAGDPELVHWFREIRKHLGLLVPGPSQWATTVALRDQEHVVAQRAVYEHRLQAMIEFLAKVGVTAPMPGGGFYLWAPAPEGAWNLATRLANDVGLIVSPGEFYGEDGSEFVRVAVVQSDEAIAELSNRLG